jgi:hypothetical protein
MKGVLVDQGGRLARTCLTCVALAACLAMSACDGDDPDVPLATLMRDIAHGARDYNTAKVFQLEADVNGAFSNPYSKDALCYIAKNTTYDKKTSVVVKTPTEADLESYLVSKTIGPLITNPIRGDLNLIATTASQVQAGDLAQAAVDVGCAA